MNVDEVSCVAEFCDFGTLVNIMKVDERYKTVCEKCLVESDEALKDLLEQDNIEAFCRYVSMYHPKLKGNEYLYYCRSPITFKYFYTKNHEVNEIYEKCIKEENSILFRFMLIDMELEHTRGKKFLFLESVRSKKYDLAKYVLDASESKIVLQLGSYTKYKPEFLNFLNKNLDKIELCLPKDLFNVPYDQWDNHVDLKCVAEIFCKCNYRPEHPIPINLVKAVFINHKNKKQFLQDILKVCINEDYIIKVLRIFDEYGIGYCTKKFITCGYSEVIDYVINRTNHDLILDIEKPYPFSYRSLQKLKDTGRLYLSAPIDKKIFTIEVLEILSSLSIR